MATEAAEYDEKMRKKKEEDAGMWDEYMEQRKQARIKEEEDLKKLKERQQRRKAQRQEHERIMQEMRRKQEEARQKELEEKRALEEEAKRKRLEEAERKRQQMQEALKKQREAAKRSFALNKKSDGSVVGTPDLANVASLGRSDIIKTKEQLAEEKKIAMQFRVKPLKLDGLSLDELKKKANELWEQIVQAESDRYDLEDRQKRQEYDLKELSERQRQINRNKALKKGLDPEALSGKYPPKLQVASKYERRLDRRDFGDKKNLFEGGWDELTKEEREKLWAERINSFKESHGDKKVNKWDPSTLRQQRQEDDQGRTIYDGDDDDALDMMDAYKPFIEGQESGAAAATESRRRSSAASYASQQQTQSRRSSTQAPSKPAPPPQEEEEEEEDEEEEEYEEEEIEEEEEEEE